MTSVTFSSYSYANVERICSQKNCMKNRCASSLKAVTVKTRLLVRLAPERIRHTSLESNKNSYKWHGWCSEQEI